MSDIDRARFKRAQEIRAGAGIVGDDNALPTKAAGSAGLTYGTKDVAVAGTAEALAVTQAIRSVAIRAKAANTGDIYVGDNAVAAATGFPLAAGEAITLNVNDLAAIYIDAAVAGEGAHYIAEVD